MLLTFNNNIKFCCLSNFYMYSLIYVTTYMQGNELVHAAYIFSWVCKCYSLHGDIYEQSTNTYKCINRVGMGTLYFTWE